MADVAVVPVPTSSQAMTAIAATNLTAMSTSDEYIINNSGKTRLIVVKTGTSSATLTIKTSVQDDSFDGLTPPTRTYSFSAANTYIIGPFAHRVYSEKLRISSSATSLSFLAIDAQAGV